MRRNYYYWFWFRFDVVWWFKRKREKIVMWIAWHLPHELVKWCFFRILAHATTGKWGYETPTSVSWMDAIDRWEEGRGLTREKMQQIKRKMDAAENQTCL